jgi:hypothetical protein
MGKICGLVFPRLQNLPFFEHLSPFGSAPDVNVGAILTKPFGLAAAGGKSVWIL